MAGPGSAPSGESLDRSTAAALDELGAYEVLSQLDCGPVTTSYLCRKSGRAGEGLFVLSVVHDELRTHRWLIEQLLAETAKCATIRNPNVESIVDFGTIRERSFVVTRYIDGCTLSQLSSLPTEIPYRIALPLVVDVLRGLHAAHTQRGPSGNRDPIVHSGVSPASIIVGRDGIARIGEFGIARVQMCTTQTMPGVRNERFAHLAPEQIGEVCEVEPSADVFAVGTVLWSILTGIPLFRGSDPVDTMHRVLHIVVPLPSTVGRHPPAWLDDICMPALEKNPGRRHPSAEHMALALQSKAVQNKCWAPRPEVAAWIQGALEKAAPAVSANPSTERTDSFEGIRASQAASAVAAPQMSAAAAAFRPAKRRGLVFAALAAGVALLAAVGFGLRSSFVSSSDEQPAQTLHGPNVAPSLIPPIVPTEPPREKNAGTEAVVTPPPTEPTPAPTHVEPLSTPNLGPADRRRAAPSPGPSANRATKAPRAALAPGGPGPNPSVAGGSPPASTATSATPPLPTIERNPYMRH